MDSSVPCSLTYDMVSVRGLAAIIHELLKAREKHFERIKHCIITLPPGHLPRVTPTGSIIAQNCNTTEQPMYDRYFFLNLVRRAFYSFQTEDRENGKVENAKRLWERG